MSVKVEKIIADRKGWFTPAEAAAFYKVSRGLDEVVLHWWNTVAARPSFSGVLNYLLHAGVPSATAGS